MRLAACARETNRQKTFFIDAAPQWGIPKRGRPRLPGYLPAHPFTKDCGGVGRFTLPHAAVGSETFRLMRPFFFATNSDAHFFSRLGLQSHLNPTRRRPR